MAPRSGLPQANITANSTVAVLLAAYFGRALTTQLTLATLCKIGQKQGHQSEPPFCLFQEGI
jgi:hypothetical protein